MECVVSVTEQSKHVLTKKEFVKQALEELVRRNRNRGRQLSQTERLSKGEKVNWDEIRIICTNRKKTYALASFFTQKSPNANKPSKTTPIGH